MSKIIENKAEKAYPYYLDEEKSIYMERRAYIKGYEEALRDIKSQVNLSATHYYQYPILHLLDWIDKHLDKKNV